MVAKASSKKGVVGGAGPGRTRAKKGGVKKGGAKKGGAKKGRAKKSGASKRGATKSGVKTSGAKKGGAKKSGAKKRGAKKSGAKTSGAERKGGAKAGGAKKKTAKRTVADYIAGLGDWRGKAATALLDLVKKGAPRATKAIKWAQPVFEQDGPFAYLKAFRSHLNFGFWRGKSLKDPKGLLKSGGAQMGHVKITDLRFDKAALTAFIKQAVKLNAKKGDPTRK